MLLASALVKAIVGYAVLACVVLGVGLMLTNGAGPFGRWDLDVCQFFARHRSGFLNALTKRATSGVGSVIRSRHAALPTLLVGGVIVAVLAKVGRWREGAVLTLAFALELAVFLPVKHVVGRARPPVFDLSHAPSTTSYPSGHTAAATVLFVGIAIVVWCCTRNRAARLVSVALAVGAVSMVGFARVYRGEHYLTDVSIGALLGLGCLLVAVAVVDTLPRRSEDRDAAGALRPAIRQ
jgi:membrane-associated phospholipid phosphatase